MSSIKSKFDLKIARTLHAIDASEWLGTGNAFWLEWDHPNERPQDFQDIVVSLESQKWRQLIKPGSTVIDIGTHSGDTTIPMGLFSYDKHNGVKGNVIGVEPNPDLHPLVEACYAVNGHIANFFLEKSAVTNEDVDEIELADHGNSNCNGGIIGSYAGGLTQMLQDGAIVRYKTRGKRLESIIHEYDAIIPSMDIQFVKTDCEGYDKEILRSSKNILQQLKPALFVEWFAWFSPEDSDDLFNVISELNYIALDPNTLSPLTSRGPRVSDITCIHRDRLGELFP